MDLKDTYNKIAEAWHQDHLSDDWWVEGTNEFLKVLPPGGSILDVGCAGGVKSRYLIEKGFSVTGVDISDKFIEIAKREVPQGTFYVADMRDLRDVPGTFDGIFAQASLLHLPHAEIKPTLAGLMHRLKRPGALYIAVKAQRDNGPREEVKVDTRYIGPHERFFSYHTSERLREVVESLGFSVAYLDVKASASSWLQIVGTLK